MTSFTITPGVDAAREFLEIAGDFTNPLELIREGISNSHDAGAETTRLTFKAVEEVGVTKIHIEIEDDGRGMDEAGLQSFFDLGNSSKRGDPATIGEKGHGTKVYFNCETLVVDTVRDELRLTATMVGPYKKLHSGSLPTVEVEKAHVPGVPNGTRVTILGFNNNKGELFTHERMKDYIKWFTKFGSFEQELGITENQHKTVVLKGLDRDEPETITFGHSFPAESEPIAKLFETHLVRAPDYYCKRVVKVGNLRKHPYIRYEAVFYLEGNLVKQANNRMLRRRGYQAPPGNYVVTDRYGIWLSKDFIPIERKNSWISQKGTEYTRFHAFFNCQKLSLTANRGSVANTPPDILADIEETIREIYDEITEGNDWREIEWLESEVEAHQTKEKESKDFDWRKGRAVKSNVCTLDGHQLVEPTRESGVYALLVQLATLRPDLFPFSIVDYDTHSGIDVLAKMKSKHGTEASALFYVELKRLLERQMNHSFSNIRYIVCWDTLVKHGDHVTDLANEERTMHVVPADPNEGGYTGYFLRKNFKQDIEVFVLKDYLAQKLGLMFRPRTVVEAEAAA